jgi:hypothetical protein
LSELFNKNPKLLYGIITDIGNAFRDVKAEVEAEVEAEVCGELQRGIKS